MLHTYNATSQDIAVNGNAIFSINSIHTGSTATHSAGAAEINLNKSGFYMVTVNAVVANPGDDAADIILALYENDTAVNGAVAALTSAGTTDVGTIGFSAIIRVEPKCGCSARSGASVLTVRNIGAAATISNIAATVTKIC